MLDQTAIPMREVGLIQAPGKHLSLNRLTQVTGLKIQLKLAFYQKLELLSLRKLHINISCQFNNRKYKS
jgi:hypothetical protein